LLILWLYSLQDEVRFCTVVAAAGDRSDHGGEKEGKEEATRY